jgi:cobalamin biosynthesis Mg chelatase CobN
VALLLLALALLLASPAFAGAETSSEVVYPLGNPNLESHSPTKPAETKKPTPHHAKPTVTHHSTPPTTGEESTETATEPTAEPKTKEHHRAAAAPAAKGGNQPPGGGKPGGDASPKAAHQGIGKSVALKSEGPSSTSGTGGSSPVVPILIAILVLATLSIGVVVYRERRSVAV